MQQISPPLRIALAAIVLLGAVWFVALRPKDSSEPQAVTPPGVQGLANSVAKARGAKEATDAANARTESAVAGADGSSTASAGTKTATGKAAAKAQRIDLGITPSDVHGPARRLVDALENGKAVVLLFSSQSADSKHVVRVVQGVFKRDGRVVVQVASIKDVADYSVFTNKTTVAQAPTTFIIGPTRKAKVIAGYTSTGEVDQAIGDVLGKHSGLDKYGKGRGRDKNG